ncbi:unnamed protein product [Heterobilharzia americana]|nr:unnamed protein product [Heterobilharzia americana]CAH8510599.1 unnamed protein product [Heterobilharzia americana]
MIILLNTYAMAFGDRQDLIGEFFDIPEVFSKSFESSKSRNPKSNVDHTTTKTQRGRSDTRKANSSRTNSHSKRKTTSSHHHYNRESKSSVCSQNDSESYHSSTCVSPVIDKNIKCDLLISRGLTDDDDDNNVFMSEPVRKVNVTSEQIDEKPLQINKLSLGNHADTAVTNVVSNNQSEEANVISPNKKSPNTSKLSIGSTSESTESLLPTQKCHRYQAIGPNPNLLGLRVIPQGPNPLLVHGPNPALVRGSIYQQTMSSCQS